MAYNTISGDYLISQIKTKEDVPFHLMRYAVIYRDQLDTFEPDMRSVLQYIVNNFLQESSNSESFTGSGTMASEATHTGSADLSTGYDWGAAAEDFTIDVNGAGAATVTLDALTSDVATTVTALNSALPAGVTAFADGVNVGIRTTTDGADQSFVLAEGTGALTTLGLSAGTYTGTDDTRLKTFTTSLDSSPADVSVSVQVGGSSRSYTVTQENPLAIELATGISAEDEVVISVSDALTAAEYLSERPLIDPINYI